MDYESLVQKYPQAGQWMQGFIEKHGYKSDYNCYCVGGKSLKEEPDRLLYILRPLVAEEEQDTSDTLEDDYHKLMEQLKKIYGKKYQSLEQQIQNFRYFHIVREESQYLWETIFYYVRRCLERINLLLFGTTDYIHGISNLFLTEAAAVWQRGTLTESDREKISRRDGKHKLAQKVWDASKLLVFPEAGDVLKGVSGSSGVVVGKVCVIHGPEEFHKMHKGDILVCQLTDPEWTPLFKLAGGVVADTSAALSHAAIVAREYGIPAVLGVGLATTRFQDGDMIRVDGDHGEVTSCSM